MKVSIINVFGNIAGYIFVALLLGIVAIMALLPTVGANRIVAMLGGDVLIWRY